MIPSPVFLSFFPFAVLLSRQFVDMSRIRIEGLLLAFPKLVGTGKQHTYVETENVRYVYQPIEALYLLLVTNKQSNILEDLDTLRLLSKLVCFFLMIYISVHALILTWSWLLWSTFFKYLGEWLSCCNFNMHGLDPTSLDLCVLHMVMHYLILSHQFC